MKVSLPAPFFSFLHNSAPALTLCGCEFNWFQPRSSSVSVHRGHIFAFSHCSVVLFISGSLIGLFLKSTDLTRKSVVFRFADGMACQWLLVMGEGHVMWLPWLRGGWDVVWLLRVAS